MVALLDIEPGSIGVDTVRAELGARVATMALGALPPEAVALYDVAQVTVQSIAAIGAAASASSALAAVPAVGAALAAIASAGRLLAATLDAETAAAIDTGLEAQALKLIAAADGRILASYQTSPVAPTGAPPSPERVYSGVDRSCPSVIKLWTPGAVACVPRPFARDVVWSLVPWASWDGIRGKATVRPGIWADETGPVVTGFRDREKGETEYKAAEKAVHDALWPTFWVEPSPAGAWSPGSGSWVVRVVEAGERQASPPVICARTLAPGLAPLAGPRGEPVPVHGRLLAYSAGLLGAPPSDLDLVIDRARAFLTTQGALADTGYGAALKERLRVLAWAREDWRRRQGLNARAWDPWPGTDAGPGLDVQQGRRPGGAAGVVGRPSGGRGGGAAIGVAGAAAAALFFLRR